MIISFIGHFFLRKANPNLCYSLKPSQLWEPDAMPIRIICSILFYTHSHEMYVYVGIIGLGQGTQAIYPLLTSFAHTTLIYVESSKPFGIKYSF